MREYYKKLDKSFFKYGITIPKDYMKEFIFDDDIPSYFAIESQEFASKQ